MHNKRLITRKRLVSEQSVKTNTHNALKHHLALSNINFSGVCIKVI